MHEFFSDVLQPLAVFGGIAMVIWASARAKLEHRKFDRQGWQAPVTQQPVAPQNDAVLSELRSMKQQMAEMQSTSHQFDLSFDAALNRLESRVGQVEARQAAAPVTTAPTAEPHDQLRNGLR